MKNDLLSLAKRHLSTLTIALLFALTTTPTYACDTSPTVTANNVQNIGGGFFTVDVQVCIGVNGSIDGYDLSFNCGLNITATSAPTQNNGGNIATASIAGGVLTYFYGGPGDFEPDDGISGPCFNQTLTLDGDPTGCTVTSTGINDGCLIIATSWSATIPGPCAVDHTLVGAGSVVGSTVGAGNNCTLRGSQDEIIQVDIPCNDTWTFSLCGGATWDTYLYLSNSCCGASIALNDDACGLQSQIATALAPGTYYITVEAFSTGTTGAYTLNVTSGSPCSVLPVGLTEFSGDYSEISRSNEITWVTSSETNNDYFVLERSADGLNFGAIADIDGQGNSYEENTYTYFDPIESADTYYYRLKQYDYDGSYSYSDVIAIKSEWDNSKFFGSIFPNPAKTAFTLITSERETASPIQLMFINAQGSVVKTEELMGHTNAANYGIDISNMKSGVYTIQLISGNESEVRKVVIL
ncbi:T9SS type A sorting domain-containing protein [Crocinitomicaceae bacterium]|nr:T9SS type A sorting domain-containing protein [Crocinitomicaceae bacterium]MDC0257839.1 T9SS type A sorting domain-containing protein [Crocinitomicaceae bacterium]